MEKDYCMTASINHHHERERVRIRVYVCVCVCERESWWFVDDFEIITSASLSHLFPLLCFIQSGFLLLIKNLSHKPIISIPHNLNEKTHTHTQRDEKNIAQKKSKTKTLRKFLLLFSATIKLCLVLIRVF